MKQKTPVVSLFALAAFVTATELPSEGRPLSDVSFVRQAFRIDLLENKQAKAILTYVHASNERSLARMILTSASASEQSLRSAAHASGLSPPTKQATPGKPPVSAFSYLEQNAEQQRTALGLYQDEARHGAKPALRAYARKHIPFIQTQLATTERATRRANGTLPAPEPSKTPMGFFAPATNPPEPEG